MVFITYLALIKPVNCGFLGRYQQISQHKIQDYSAFHQQKMIVFKQGRENLKIRIIKFEKQNG